jgi:imidazolonepropionase-like amidohydrolase
MILRALSILVLLPCAARAELVAYRVARAETVAHGTVEHAVLLVGDGKLVALGEDLPVERGIRVVDLPAWTVMPGLVLLDSRLGMDGQAGSGTHPEVLASDELFPQADEYERVRALGVTTIGLSPAGGGIPGRGVAVKPRGATPEEMILRDPAYLKVELQASKSSKNAFKDGFEKADKHLKKVAEAREKWEKEQEKKKSKGKKSDEKKPEEKKAEEKKDEKSAPAQEEEKKEEPEPSDVFTPPAAEMEVQVFLDLRAKTLPALIQISGAAEFLHFVDALGTEEIDWTLRNRLGGTSDLHYVYDKETWGLDVDGIGDREARIVLEARTSLQPGTMRERNVAAELVAAGAKVALVPTDESLTSGLADWRSDVGRLVAKGLPREAALRAITLEPALFLGVAERVGSLEEGKDADLVFLDGDPLEATTRVRAVLIDGRLVHGEVAP